MADAAPAADGGADALRDDLISALLNLGYQQAAADQVVAAALEAGATAFEPALKDALKRLAKRSS
jgi:Holliday junction resolvasome RuvABC DNA-binding subunit